MRAVAGRAAALLGVLTIGIPCSAQDWRDVEALSPGTELRVEQDAGAGGVIKGRLLDVDPTRLTVSTSRGSMVLERSAIARISRRHRDPVWQGAIVGGLLALGMRLAFADGACARIAEPRCTLQGAVTGAAVGALIDYAIPASREVYRAPPRQAAVLRLRF